jgi:hypothetical protein
MTQTFADFGQKRRDLQLSGENKRSLVLYVCPIRFPLPRQNIPKDDQR